MAAAKKRHRDERETEPSTVEAAALRSSGRGRLQYDGENLGVCEVATFPQLGLVVAARFIEWAQRHPEGVVSLPTGRTPEHFITNVGRLIAADWDARGEGSAFEELTALGVDVSLGKPDMKSLTFVQMDEFYPMDPRQGNSFNAYIRKHYLQNFGMDEKKAMLVRGPLSVYSCIVSFWRSPRIRLRAPCACQGGPCLSVIFLPHPVCVSLPAKRCDRWTCGRSGARMAAMLEWCSATTASI